MQQYPSIGILAGMGPRSTTPFLELVLNECKKQYNAKNDIDYPQMLIYSLPTPFFVDRPLDHNAMRQVLIEGLKRLEDTNVSFIVMPANTIHQYFDELQKSITTPLLHIVYETINRIPLEYCPVTVLATESTMQSEIYQKTLTEKGFTHIFKEEWQQEVNALIRGVKEGMEKELLRSRLQSLLQKIEVEGPQGVIIACTDLTMLLDELQTGLFILDSAKCLAEATVEKYISFSPPLESRF